MANEPNGPKPNQPLPPDPNNPNPIPQPNPPVPAAVEAPMPTTLDSAIAEIAKLRQLLKNAQELQAESNDLIDEYRTALVAKRG